MPDRISPDIETHLGLVSQLDVLPSESSYRQAVERMRAAADAYYNGTDLVMDDAVYDELARTIAATEVVHPEWADPATSSVAAGVAGGDVTHTAAMLSLDNVFSTEELTSFLEKVTRLVGYDVPAWRVEPKLDGLALAAHYVDGVLVGMVTRGDGRTGEDVMHAQPAIKGLPLRLSRPDTVEIRGEVMMTDADFAAANEIRLAHNEPPLVNPRNGAAGTLRARGRDYTLPLTFFAYTLLEDGRESRDQHAAMEYVASLGVSTSPGAVLAHSANEVVSAVEGFLARRSEIGLAIDGAVIKVDDLDTRLLAGSTSRAPRWAIAYKYPADTRATDLLGIEVNVGRTGNLSFTAQLAPVAVGGVVVSSASVHNPSVIRAKGLRVPAADGSPVQQVYVRRAGDVIPEITGPAHTPEGTIEFPEPTACPRCGGPLDVSGLIWRCRRGRECAVEAVLTYAVSRDCLDIDALGPTLISSLVEAGELTRVTDLFELTAEQLESLDRVGPTLANKIIDNIHAARALPMNRVFCSLGVTMTGRSMSRRLAGAFTTMPNLRAATVEQLQEVEGVGPERARSIYEELRQISDELDYLEVNRIGQREPQAPRPAEGPLTGTVWVVTGVMVGPLQGYTRERMHGLLQSLGATVATSVTRQTSTVLVGTSAGSKATKAAQLGIPMMTEDEFAARYLG